MFRCSFFYFKTNFQLAASFKQHRQYNFTYTCMPLFMYLRKFEIETISLDNRALIFHKIFPWVPLLFLTLWPRPWSLTHFFKTLTLLITFEQWVLELLYCTWAFLVTRSSYWYQDFCPCDLGHLWNWPLSGAYVFHKHILFKM